MSKKTIVTKNGRVVDCQVLWGMIRHSDNTKETLKAQILKFSTLATNPTVQAGYYVTMENLGSTFKPLLDQIMPPEKTTVPRIGEYWEKLLAVCDHEVEIIHSQTMNEIFQDEVITYVVGIIWAAVGLLPNMWTAEMNMFAFRHT
jgi:hypothetical protein